MLRQWIFSDRISEVASRRLDAADCGETRREAPFGSGVEVAVGPDGVRWGKKDSRDRDRTLGMQ